MTGRNPIDPGHNQTRTLLRAGGLLMMAVGGLFFLVGAVDFFSAFATMRAPTLFWYMLVGLPLLTLGFAITKAGFAGKVARYYSQEYTPVATDTFNYAARQAKDGIRDVAGAIAEGVTVPKQVEVADGAPSADAGRAQPATDHPSRAGFGRAGDRSRQPTGAIECHRCHHDNTPEARFCSACGVALARNTPCPSCRELNDADAKFCDHCGKPM